MMGIIISPLVQAVQTFVQRQPDAPSASCKMALSDPGKARAIAEILLPLKPS